MFGQERHINNNVVKINISFVCTLDNTWSMSLWNVRSLNRMVFDWIDNAYTEWKRLFFMHQTHALLFDEILTRSNTLKYYALPSSSNISVILGRGYASLIVFSFNVRKSITILHPLLRWIWFFEDDPYEWIIWWIWGLITSFIIKSFTCLLTSSL